MTRYTKIYGTWLTDIVRRVYKYMINKVAAWSVGWLALLLIVLRNVRNKILVRWGILLLTVIADLLLTISLSLGWKFIFVSFGDISVPECASYAIYKVAYMRRSILNTNYNSFQFKQKHLLYEIESSGSIKSYQVISFYFKFSGQKCIVNLV